MFTVKNWTGGKNTPFRPRGAQPFNTPPEAAAPKNKQEGRCPRGGASSCLLFYKFYKAAQPNSVSLERSGSPQSTVGCSR